MKCLIHKWSSWSEPKEGYQINGRGSFGDTSKDDVIFQERVCSRCHKIQREII